MVKSGQLSTDSILAVIKVGHADPDLVAIREDYKANDQHAQYIIVEDPTRSWAGEKDLVIINASDERKKLYQKKMDILSKVPLQDILIMIPADFRRSYENNASYEVLYLNPDKFLSTLSDEQLLDLLKSQLTTDSIELQEGDEWYGGTTQILSYNPSTDSFNIITDVWDDEDDMWDDEDDMWDDAEGDFDDGYYTQEDTVPAQELIDYLRKRNFGSIESEKTFNESLRTLLLDFLENGS